MWMIMAGVFFILHGLVHLLYAGQALRYFELHPGMIWPDGAWLFSRLLGNEITRWLAAILLALTALGYAVGGLGLLFGQEWWRLVVVGAALLSSAIFILLWDGAFRALADKGGVGILINLAILAVVTILKWPA